MITIIIATTEIIIETIITIITISIEIITIISIRY